MGPIQSLADLFSLVRRRKWLILFVFLLGTAATVYYAKTRPREYEATAVLQIEMPAVTTNSDPMASDSGATAIQLQVIQQRLTTREALVDLMARHGLFDDLPGLSTDQRVAIMRSAIRFDTVASVANTSNGAPTRIAALAVTARIGTAEQSARVANDLAQAILDRGAQGRATRANDTLQFFTDEETRLWNDIVALEAEIAAYKNRNANALPAQQAALQLELTGIETDLRGLEQSQLALVAQRDALAAQAELRTTGQRQLAELNVQITAINQQKAGLETRRATVTQSMANAPEVDSALNAYDRRLSQLQDQHDVVSQRLAEAQTTQRLAERQQSERFSLLERAVTPEYPVSSARKKIAVAGALGSLLLAFGLAILLDLRKPVVRTSAQMERLTGLRPVVVIPEVALKKPRRKKSAESAQSA